MMMLKQALSCSLLATTLLALASRPAVGAEENHGGLHRAAAQGDLARVRELLAQGVPVDGRDATGRTALMHAAAQGSEQVVATLLEAHSDVNASNGSGLTALVAAAHEDHLAVLRELLEAGADPDHRHRAWGTALDMAETARNAEMARVLRAHGARGSGKSIGDTVCVRPWSGDGYCGRVVSRNGPRSRLEVTELVGCAAGCEARPDCSANRAVGGGGETALSVGDVVDVPGECLTHTNVGGAR